MLTWIALARIVAALILLFNHRRQRERGGLPSGELVYSDAVAQDVPVLISHRYGLKGKPDALIRIPSGEVILVERKKSRAPRTPMKTISFKRLRIACWWRRITSGLRHS
jgi:hypothetical protein